MKNAIYIIAAIILLAIIGNFLPESKPVFTKADYQGILDSLCGAYEFSSDKVILQTRKKCNELHIVPVQQRKPLASKRTIAFMFDKVVTDKSLTLCAYNKQNDTIVISITRDSKDVLLREVINKDTVLVSKGLIRSVL